MTRLAVPRDFGPGRRAVLAAGVNLALPGCAFDLVQRPGAAVAPRGGVATVAVSSDGSLIAAEYRATPIVDPFRYGQLCVFRPLNGALTPLQAGAGFEFKDPEFSPDGRHLVAVRVAISASRREIGDPDLAIFDLERGGVQILSPPWRARLARPKFTPDGRGLIYCAIPQLASRDWEAIIFHPLDGGLPTEFLRLDEMFFDLRGLTFRGDSEILFAPLLRTAWPREEASRGAEGGYRLTRVAYRLVFDLATGQRRGAPTLLLSERDLPPASLGLYGLTAPADGASLFWYASSRSDRAAGGLAPDNVFERRDGRIHQVTDFRSTIRGIALSRDGRALAVTENGRDEVFYDLALMDVASGEVRRTGLLNRLLSST